MRGMPSDFLDDRSTLGRLPVEFSSERVGRLLDLSDQRNHHPNRAFSALDIVRGHSKGGQRTRLSDSLCPEVGGDVRLLRGGSDPESVILGQQPVEGKVRGQAPRRTQSGPHGNGSQPPILRPGDDLTLLAADPAESVSISIRTSISVLGPLDSHKFTAAPHPR